MAYYKQGIVSKNFDPIHHSKTRTEFQLEPNTMYVSDLKLLNVGVVKDRELGVCLYNWLGGALSVIKNIYLYDGRQILDQLVNHDNWMAFVKYNSTNAESIELSSVLHKNSMGFVFNKDAGLYDEETPEDSVYPTLPTIQWMNNRVDTIVTTDADTTAMAYINLTDVFPFLKKIGVLDTVLFQNLRLVIEYSNEKSIAVIGDQVNKAIKINAITQPILVADEITNLQAVASVRSQFKGVVWNCMEVESVLLPVPTVGELASLTQKRSYKLSGLTNKTLFKMLIQKSCSDLTLTDSTGYKTLGSEAMERETWQVCVNNMNLFPNNGIISSNERLQLLTQTWGTCNSIPCGTGGFIIARNYGTETDIITGPLARTGHTDYFGCMISQAVKSLSISYSRGVSIDMAEVYLSPININIFAEVQKILTPVKGGSYTVRYL
jgi:hypothetical protein